MRVGTDQAISSDSQIWVTESCGIVWEKLEELLSGIEEEYASKKWYFEAVVKLAPLFTHCYNILMKLTQDDYRRLIQPYLEWTHQGAEVDACMKEISEGSFNSDHLVALLTVTAITERSLGNLVLMKQEQVPFLLRDLLVTTELKELVGNTRVQLLRILLGSVLGINLRNIAWHGFLSPCEANPAFVATLIIILADCGRWLKDCSVTNVPCRPFVSFKEACCPMSVFEKVDIPPRPVMEEVITKSPLVPTIMIPVWMKALDLLAEKRWGLSVTALLPMLECSLRCLFAHTNEVSERVLTAENSTLYTTLDEILEPCINEGICDSVDLVNDDQSAEQSTHNVLEENTRNNTDIYFKHEIPSYTSTEARKLSSNNHILLFIGKKLNEALHDLLNFVQGPRVRDRISHGEVRLKEFPQEIAQHTLCLCILVLSLGNWRSKLQGICICNKNKHCSQCNADYVHFLDPGMGIMCCDLKQIYIKSVAGNHKIKDCINGLFDFISITETSENLNDLLAVLSDGIEKYKSIYHPTAILHNKLVSSASQLKDWLTWKKVDADELGYDNWEGWNNLELPEIVSISSLGNTHEIKGLNNIKDFSSQICNVNYEVLYRPKPELEIVSILQRIASNVHSALDNICKNLSIKYSQYIDKKLRSRQRETYRRQLNAIPVIILNIYFTLQIIYMVFFSVNKVSELSKPCFNNLIKMFKLMLKVQENIVSQTDLNANRWDEAASNSLRNIETLRQYFSS